MKDNDQEVGPEFFLVEKPVFTREQVKDLLREAGKISKRTHKIADYSIEDETTYWATVDIESALKWYLENSAHKHFSEGARFMQSFDMPISERQKKHQSIRKKALSLAEELLKYNPQSSELAGSLLAFVRSEEQTRRLTAALFPKGEGKRHTLKKPKRKFIEDLFFVWRNVLGKDISYSRGSTGKNEGKVGGPLFRFVQKTLKVVGEDIEPETFVDWTDKYKRRIEQMGK